MNEKKQIKSYTLTPETGAMIEAYKVLVDLPDDEFKRRMLRAYRLSAKSLLIALIDTFVEPEELGKPNIGPDGGKTIAIYWNANRNSYEVMYSADEVEFEHFSQGAVELREKDLHNFTETAALHGYAVDIRGKGK